MVLKKDLSFLKIGLFLILFTSQKSNAYSNFKQLKNVFVLANILANNVEIKRNFCICRNLKIYGDLNCIIPIATGGQAGPTGAAGLSFLDQVKVLWWPTLLNQ